MFVSSVKMSNSYFIKFYINGICFSLVGIGHHCWLQQVTKVWYLDYNLRLDLFQTFVTLFLTFINQPCSCFSSPFELLTSVKISYVWQWLGNRMEQRTLKNVNNYLNINIYSYLEGPGKSTYQLSAFRNVLSATSSRYLPLWLR